jgi:hypothetical protein
MAAMPEAEVNIRRLDALISSTPELLCVKYVVWRCEVTETGVFSGNLKHTLGSVLDVYRHARPWCNGRVAT